jgi:hypothetical protein
MTTTRRDPIGNSFQIKTGACAPVLIPKLTGTVMLKTSPPRPPRNRVDLSTKDLTRLWCKHFGKTKAQIEAAISKVGDNAATVSKELEARPALGPRL